MTDICGEAAVAKSDWGTKRQCPSCGARFYDLNRTPITCVKCDTVFEPERLLKSRRQKEPAPIRKPVAPPQPKDAAAGDKPAATADQEKAATPDQEKVATIDQKKAATPDQEKVATIDQKKDGAGA